MFHDSESVQQQVEEVAAVSEPKIITLYPDQVDVLLEAQQHLLAGKKVMVQMPTGAGKTVVAAKLIEVMSKAKKVWFLAHRKQLVKQASETLTEYGISHGVIAPGYEKNYGAQVQVASINKLSYFSKNYGTPDIVVWDEGLHIAAKSWARLMASFGDIPQIGLSATPERFDGKGLSDYFDVLVIGKPVRWLIDQNRLSDFRFYSPSGVDLTNAKIMAGEYHKEDVDKAMKRSVVIGDVIEHYKKYADGKRGIIFAWNIDASKRTVERFNEAGIPATHLDANSTDDERDEAVKALEAGTLRMISNVEIFSEGFNLPSLDCVILLRPTRSLALYLQMVGRGLRYKEGKEPTVILDHAGLYYDHGGLPDQPWEWSLDGGAKKRRMAAMRVSGERIGRRCPSCGEVHRERVISCDCGYEFPSGRDVGEFDGELLIIDGCTPAGYETKAVFAQRISVSPQTLLNLIAKGLPFNGLFHVESAMEWLKENWRPRTSPPIDVDDPESYVAPNEFEALADLSRGEVLKLREKGLPCAANGWVHKEEGLAWVNKNKTRRRRIAPGIGELSPSDIAKKYGVSIETVKNWVKRGMEVEDSGALNGLKVDDWLSSNRTKIKSKPIDGCESKTEFRRRIGLSKSGMNRLVRDGIPVNSSGLVRVDDALEWLKARKSRRIAPIGKENPDEYESQAKFAKRTGYAEGTIPAWVKRGLPVADNGWVNIECGLKWVKDNINEKDAIRLINDDLYETPIAFARRFGVTRSRVRKWKMDGLPVDDSGRVNIHKGAAWVAKNWTGDRYTPPRDVDVPEGYEPQHKFAERAGISRGMVSDFCKRGMPHSSNSWVNYNLAMDWIRMNTLVGGECETQKSFAKRLGVDPRVVTKWNRRHGMKRGMNAVVHIQSGLEWVRDNTNIEIPPEAWPKKEEDSGDQND